jgi:hypothetical protein
MGKRVDFSARTVITGIGIPIAWGSPLDVLCCIGNNCALKCCLRAAEQDKGVDL